MTYDEFFKQATGNEQAPDAYQCLLVGAQAAHPQGGIQPLPGLLVTVGQQLRPEENCWCGFHLHATNRRNLVCSSGRNGGPLTPKLTLCHG